jgi:hypothetical protein
VFDSWVLRIGEGDLIRSIGLVKIHISLESNKQSLARVVGTNLSNVPGALTPRVGVILVVVVVVLALVELDITICQVITVSSVSLNTRCRVGVHVWDYDNHRFGGTIRSLEASAYADFSRGRTCWHTFVVDSKNSHDLLSSKIKFVSHFNELGVVGISHICFLRGNLIVKEGLSADGADQEGFDNKILF